MKKLLLLLLCVPLIGFAQNNDVKMLSISESEFINCQNKYLDIKKSGISFINFYHILRPYFWNKNSQSGFIIFT